MYTFHAQAGYSHFSSDFRLKLFLCTFLGSIAKKINVRGQTIGDRVQYLYFGLIKRM